MDRPNTGSADLEKEPGPTLIRSLGFEFGERNGPNPGLAGSEKELFFYHIFFFSFFHSFLSVFFHIFFLPLFFFFLKKRERTWPNPGSEFGSGERQRFEVQRKELAKPWFSRFGVQRKDPG